jgi:uncharacterized protein YqeY
MKIRELTVQKKIALDLEAAMVLRDNPTRDLLRVVKGEFEREGKIVSDERALSIIKKMYENATEFGTAHEADVLSGYLPTPLSIEELTINIEHYAVMHKLEMKDMGRIMSFLKKNYEGRYDGKKASEIVRGILANQS